MKYVDAYNRAHQFWMEPEGTPFPRDVQRQLLSSERSNYLHVGAMAVVYEGVRTSDTSKIEEAKSVLQEARSVAELTEDSLRATRDLSYIGLYMQLARRAREPDFLGSSQRSYKATYDKGQELSGCKGFNAGDFSGMLSELIVVNLLNEVALNAMPSYPWQDSPYHIGQRFPSGHNTGYDITVAHERVLKSKVQVRAGLKWPAKNMPVDIKKRWETLSAEERRVAMVDAYAPDIALIVLDTDLNVPRHEQSRRFKEFRDQTDGNNDEWRVQARGAVIGAVMSA